MNTVVPGQLVANYKSGWSLEQPFYTSATIFDLEFEHIWRKYWLFAGTTADIPKAGDYFTYQLHKDSIVIIRGSHGEVYAHYNTCRHRGSIICLEEKGNAPKLVCPYHQWVFDKDGTLLKARLMPDDFDKSTHGLHPVHVKVADGFIFISLAKDPPDFSRVLKDYAPFLRPFKINEAKVAYQEKIYSAYQLETGGRKFPGMLSLRPRASGVLQCCYRRQSPGIG